MFLSIVPSTGCWGSTRSSTLSHNTWNWSSSCWSVTSTWLSQLELCGRRLLLTGESHHKLGLLTGDSCSKLGLLTGDSYSKLGLLTGDSCSKLGLLTGDSYSKLGLLTGDSCLNLGLLNSRNVQYITTKSEDLTQWLSVDLWGQEYRVQIPGHGESDPFLL